MTDLDQSGIDKTAFRILKGPSIGEVDVPSSQSPLPTTAGGLNGQVQVNAGGNLGGLTNTQLTAKVLPFSSSLAGVVPASGGGSSNFLRADGGWVPAGTSISSVSPMDYGALANGSNSPIGQAAWQANTQWIGNYDPLTQWDVVGLQEAIYAAFAVNSDPAPANAIKCSCAGPRHTYLVGGAWLIGRLVNGVTTNNKLFGVEVVRFQAAPAAGFWIQFDFRQGARVVTECTYYQDAGTQTHGTFQWQGSNDQTAWTNIGSTFTFGGTSPQIQTSLNGNAVAYSSYRLLGISGTLNSTPLPQQFQFKVGGSYDTSNRFGLLNWNTMGGYTYLNQGLYIPNGRYMINRGLFATVNNFDIRFQSRGSTTLNWIGDINTIPLSFDAAAYGTITNPTINAFSPSGGIQQEPLIDFDASGTPIAALKTQQLTIYDMVLFGQGVSNWGCAISRSGNAAQGDTIVFVNPFVSGFTNTGISTGGQNALSVKIIGGDFQSCLRNAIEMDVGMFNIDGTSFQNQALQFDNSPSLSQVAFDGADIRGYAGQGPTNITTVENIRSESDMFYNHEVVSGTVENSACAQAGYTDWFTTYPHRKSWLLIPSANNTKRRGFISVSDSGTGWNITDGYLRADGPGSGSGTVKALVNPAWTVNQWITNFRIFWRYGSNGFTIHGGPITANSANTVSDGSSSYGDGTSNSTLFFISGQSGASAPNFDSLGEGGFIPSGQTSQGFSTTAGSAVITATTGPINNGDGVVIPSAGMQFGTTGNNGTVLDYAYIGRVVSGGGTGTLTMDTQASTTLSFVGGYWGPTLTDNKIFWMHLPAAMVRNTLSIENCYFPGPGRVFNPGKVGNMAVGSTAERPFLPDPSTIISNASTYLDVSSPKKYYQVDASNDMAGSATYDLTTIFGRTDEILFTPNQNVTLNAPLPEYRFLKRRITIRIVTAGTTPFTITFGTNFRTSGTLVTGAVDAKIFIIVFESGTTIAGTSPVWCEVSRIGPL